MKAKVDDGVSLLVSIKGNYQAMIPAGTKGVILECYENPEGYFADVWIPDCNEVGGNRYDYTILTPDQFEVEPDSK